VCTALATLPSLIELHVNIENNEEVDLLRDALPRLQYLNGYPLHGGEEVDEADSHEDFQGLGDAVGVGFDLTQKNLEDIAEL